MQPCKQATVWGGFAPDCPVGTGGVMAGALFTSPLPEALAHTVSMAGPHHRARCMAGSAPHPGRARGPVWGPGGRIVTMAGSREGGHLSPTLQMLRERYSRPLTPVEVDNAETFERSDGAVVLPRCAWGVLICPRCGLDYSGPFAERHGETPRRMGGQPGRLVVGPFPREIPRPHEVQALQPLAAHQLGSCRSGWRILLVPR